jgi:hypothetical protein
VFTARCGLSVYVFCVDLRTKSDYFHWLTGLCNWDGVCSLRGADWVCFVWIWEQIAIISIDWLVCITETECVHCAVRTECLCFVWISEQTAIISIYSIDWLVCITETECVYCAVRAGSLNIMQVNVYLQDCYRTASEYCGWRCIDTATHCTVGSYSATVLFFLRNLLHRRDIQCVQR